MLYTSLEFAVFLAAVVLGYHGCPLRWRRGYLLVASYAYYCTWSIRFGVLLLAVSGLAYWIGNRIAASPDPNRRYAYVWTGVLLLVLPLLAFKYVGGLEAMTGWLAGSTVGAALVAENKALAHPASVDSIPTSANQEDHVSMAAHGARRLLQQPVQPRLDRRQPQRTRCPSQLLDHGHRSPPAVRLS